ncbi:hypothetical protein C8R41DRAFT_73689 [Lentinula lateritia]|uniref:Uncharacterized protein n=1 Tax=Lentinula lateritia TaxID=40482 RepID=A0ABQ8V0K9_9AGAR|nr:hypothetical protein C8R41DRAFT_73689 [Lentinula lateritia]
MRKPPIHTDTSMPKLYQNPVSTNMTLSTAVQLQTFVILCYTPRMNPYDISVPCDGSIEEILCYPVTVRRHSPRGSSQIQLLRSCCSCCWHCVLWNTLYPSFQPRLRSDILRAWGESVLVFVG